MYTCQLIHYDRPLVHSVSSVAESVFLFYYYFFLYRVNGFGILDGRLFKQFLEHVFGDKTNHLLVLF